MCQAERERHGRFMFERDRRMYLATRALVRSVLSCYAGVPPEAWRFGQEKSGKPFVSGPAPIPALGFNLSNAVGLVACAVAASPARVGIDVEPLDRTADLLDLAGRYFAAHEVNVLRQLPPERQREAFLRFWTLKESYLKARGEGLSLPLEQFWFLVESDTKIRMQFDPRLNDVADRWRCLSTTLEGSHMAAVSLDCGVSAMKMDVRRCVPFHSADVLYRISTA